ncbi:MAG TPA: hypothetical protein VH540_11780 [Ktedonobacterales bacterium]|jgi:hypothetical protein
MGGGHASLIARLARALSQEVAVVLTGGATRMFHFRHDDTNQPNPSDEEYPYHRVNEPERRPRWREAPVWREATREEEAEFERRRDEVLRQMAEQWGDAARPAPLDAAEVERRKQTIMNFFAPRQEPPSPAFPGRDAGATSVGPGAARSTGDPAGASLPGAAVPPFFTGVAGATSVGPGRLETGGTEPPSPAPAEETLALPAEPPRPVYLLVGEAPPLERPLRRQPPTLGKIAPLPLAASGAPAGEWAGRWASLTTADDPYYVLLVGINALMELRLAQWASPGGQDESRLHPPLALLNAQVPPLEWDAARAWPRERLLARLGTESERLMRVLEGPLPSASVWMREAFREVQQQGIHKRQKRLEVLVAALCRQVYKRGTVRLIGELVTRLAWQAVDTR